MEMEKNQMGLPIMFLFMHLSNQYVKAHDIKTLRQ